MARYSRTEVIEMQKYLGRRRSRKECLDVIGKLKEYLPRKTIARLTGIKPGSLDNILYENDQYLVNGSTMFVLKQLLIEIRDLEKRMKKEQQFVNKMLDLDNRLRPRR